MLGGSMPARSQLLESVAGLQLSHLPVAMAFLDAPPEVLPRVNRAEAAGCGYWKRASEGRGFYTEGVDHHNCTIGALTHGVNLPPARTEELQSVVGTMLELR